MATMKEHTIKSLLQPHGKQRDIAKKIGVTQQAVSLWVANNRIPPNHCPLIANEYGINIRLLNPIFKDAL